METIRVRRQINSDTLTMPELRPFFGKTVEITVRQESEVTITPGTGNWSAMQSAASGLAGYDFDAWRLQRELDQEHACGSLP